MSWALWPSPGSDDNNSDLWGISPRHALHKKYVYHNQLFSLSLPGIKPATYLLSVATVVLVYYCNGLALLTN